MCTYSIDLAVHPQATGGHTGKDPVNDFYPLQVALTQGTLVPDPESGLNTGFKPDALASFHQIKAWDTIIFRVFDTGSICPIPGRFLQGVDLLQVTFTDLQGLETSKPWQDDEIFPFSKFEPDQSSLAFTSELGGMNLPCYHQCYLGRLEEIVTHTVQQTTDQSPYLFSVVVRAELGTPGGTETFYYRDDPEMVVSPDEGQGPPYGGDEDRVDQSAGIAATSL